MYILVVNLSFVSVACPNPKLDLEESAFLASGLEII